MSTSETNNNVGSSGNNIVVSNVATSVGAGGTSSSNVVTTGSISSNTASANSGTAASLNTTARVGCSSGSVVNSQTITTTTTTQGAKITQVKSGGDGAGNNVSGGGNAGTTTVVATVVGTGAAIVGANQTAITCDPQTSGSVASGTVSGGAAIKVATASISNTVSGCTVTSTMTQPIALSTTQGTATTAIRAIGAGGQSTQVRVVMPPGLMTPNMFKQLESAAGRTQITAIPATTARSVSNTSITVTRPVSQAAYLPRATVTAAQMAGVGVAPGQRLITPIRAASASAGTVSVAAGGAAVTGIAASSFVRGTAVTRNSNSPSTTVISPATSTTWMAANTTGQVQLIRAIPHQTRQRIITTSGITNAGASGAQSGNTTTVGVSVANAAQVQHSTAGAQSQNNQATVQAVTSQVVSGTTHNQQQPQTYVATLATVLPQRQQHQATLVYSSNVAGTALTQAQQFSPAVAAGQRFTVAAPLGATAATTTGARQIRPIPLGKSFPTKLNTTSISIRAPNLPQLTPTLAAGVSGTTVSPTSRSATVSGITGTTANVIPSTNLSTTRIIQLQQPQPSSGGTAPQIIGPTGRIAGNVMLQPIIVNASGKIGFRPPVTMAGKVQPSLTITQLGIGKLPATATVATVSAPAVTAAATTTTTTTTVTGTTGNTTATIVTTVAANTAISVANNAGQQSQQQIITTANVQPISSSSSNSSGSSSGSASPSITSSTVAVPSSISGSGLTNLSTGVHTQSVISSTSCIGGTNSNNNSNTVLAPSNPTVVPLAIATRGSSGNILTGTITSIKNANGITVGKVMSPATLANISAIQGSSGSENSTSSPTTSGTNTNSIIVATGGSGITTSAAATTSTTQLTGANTNVYIQQQQQHSITTTTTTNSGDSGTTTSTTDSATVVVSSSLTNPTTQRNNNNNGNSPESVSNASTADNNNSNTTTASNIGGVNVASTSIGNVSNATISGIVTATSLVATAAASPSLSSSSSSSTSTASSSASSIALTATVATVTNVITTPLSTSSSSNALTPVTVGASSVPPTASIVTSIAGQAASFLPPGSTIYYESIPASSVQVSTGALSLTSTTVTTSQSQQNQSQTTAGSSMFSAVNASGTTFTVVPSSGSVRAIGQLQVPVSSGNGSGLQAVPLNFNAQQIGANQTITTGETLTVSQGIGNASQQIIVPAAGAHQTVGTTPHISSNSCSGSSGSSGPHMIHNPLQTSIKIGGAGTTIVSNFLRKRDTTGSPPVVRAAKNLAPTLLAMSSASASSSNGHNGDGSNGSSSVSSSIGGNTTYTTIPNIGSPPIVNTTPLTAETLAENERMIGYRTMQLIMRPESPVSPGSSTISANSSPGLEQQIHDGGIIIDGRYASSESHFNPIKELYPNQHHPMSSYHQQYQSGPQSHIRFNTTACESYQHHQLQYQQHHHQQQQQQQQQIISYNSHGLNGDDIGCDYPTRKKRRSTDDSQQSNQSQNSLCYVNVGPYSVGNGDNNNIGLLNINATNYHSIQYGIDTETVNIQQMGYDPCIDNYDMGPSTSTGIMTSSTTIQRYRNLPQGVMHYTGNKENAKPIHYILRRPRGISLIDTEKQTRNWKLNYNHFQRQSDVKPREERRPTIMDIANQAQISTRINGWKVHHLCTQMEDLVSDETETYERLNRVLESFEVDGERDEDSLNMEKMSDLVKGNMQRIKIIVDGINEAQSQIMKMFEHKTHVADIIQRCASKRNFKKRDKL